MKDVWLRHYGWIVGIGLVVLGVVMFVGVADGAARGGLEVVSFLFAWLMVVGGLLQLWACLSYRDNNRK